MINLADKIKNIKLLNELDLDNKKIILILLISAFVFYLDFNFIFKAQLKGIKKSSIEAAKLKNGLNNFKKDSKNMQDVRSKEALSPQKPGPKLKRIISENQFASLLQDISKIANNNDVRILLIKPSREPQGAARDKIKTLGSLSSFFISLDLLSGYHNLGKFINELENLQAFVSVQEIKIEPQDDDYLKQRANLILITYVKK